MISGFFSRTFDCKVGLPEVPWNPGQLEAPGGSTDPFCIQGCKAGERTGQMKVVDVETHDNPIPIESYTMRQRKVWAVICHPGKPIIIYVFKRV